MKVSDIMTKNLLAVGSETTISKTQAFWVLSFEEFRNNCMVSSLTIIEKLSASNQK